MKIDDFKAILSRGHVYRYLFHFTDKSNIALIAQHGLLSKAHLKVRGIVVPRPGGNDWSRNADELSGLNHYVSLCFTTSHPMCHLAHMDGRIPEPIYLAISPDILTIPGVKITLGVANKAGEKKLDVEEGLDGLDVQVLYTRTDWSDPQIQTRLRNAEKCEILVPDAVDRKYIIGKIK